MFVFKIIILDRFLSINCVSKYIKSPFIVKKKFNTKQYYLKILDIKRKQMVCYKKKGNKWYYD